MSEQTTVYQVVSIKDGGRPIIINQCYQVELARAIALNECRDWRKGDNETYKLEVRKVKTKVVFTLVVKE